MNKLYSVHDHWTDINKKNDVDIESIDGVITGIKVNGEDYGGGVTWNTVFEGNVTTVSEGAFASGDIVGLESLDGDSVRVTFNGVEYTLPKHELGYGELGDGNIPDFTNYPLFIENTDTPCLLYTQTAGTYSLKIEEPQSGGGGDLLAVGIYNTFNTTVTLKYFEEQGASPVDITVESGAGIAMSVPKNSGFMATSSQHKMGSKTADAFTIETEPFASAMVLNAGVLFLTHDIQ